MDSLKKKMEENDRALEGNERPLAQRREDQSDWEGRGLRGISQGPISAQVKFIRISVDLTSDLNAGCVYHTSCNILEYET